MANGFYHIAPFSVSWMDGLKKWTLGVGRFFLPLSKF
jgi:hypothetical protein